MNEAHSSWPCPECRSSETHVIDSRPQHVRSKHIRRRRKCVGCGHRWSTFEIHEDRYMTLTGRRNAAQEVWGKLTVGFIEGAQQT